MGLAILIVGLLIITGLAGFCARKYLEFSVRTAVAIAAIGLLVDAGISVGVWAFSYRNPHWVTCHVTDKDRGGKEDGYRVYTEECDTLGNEDSMFQGKRNSSNLWQKIEPGNTYRFYILGSRSEFWSNFKNIMKVELVGPDNSKAPNQNNNQSNGNLPGYCQQSNYAQLDKNQLLFCGGYFTEASQRVLEELGRR